jgi:predicted enzyme related to lactoylglutathione lyase
MDLNLSGILIGSEDPARLSAYYAKLLGEPGWQEGGFTGWKLGDVWIAIGFHDAVKGANAHPGRLIWNLESPDVPGDFERLKAAGASVVQEPYHPGDETQGWVATFSDPDDNYFQLVSPM